MATLLLQAHLPFFSFYMHSKCILYPILYSSFILDIKLDLKQTLLLFPGYVNATCNKLQCYGIFIEFLWNCTVTLCVVVTSTSDYNAMTAYVVVKLVVFKKIPLLPGLCLPFGLPASSFNVFSIHFLCQNQRAVSPKTYMTACMYALSKLTIACIDSKVNSCGQSFL